MHILAALHRWHSGSALAIALAIGQPIPALSSDAPPPAPGDLGLTSAQCQELLRQLPSGDAEYVPGISADGQAVAPADLPAADGGSPFDVVEIRLLGKPDPTGREGIATELRAGILRVDTRTGRVTLDGRDLAGTDGATLARFCTALREREGG